MEEHHQWVLKELGYKEVIEGCELHHKKLIHRTAELHLVECGNLKGELVLLLHGFPNFWFVWKDQFKALEDAGYHIVAPDLRGYNTSSRPQDIISYSRSNIMGDIFYLIQCFNEGMPTNIVGHDWGGFAALCFAEENPCMVSRLTIVNASHIKSLSSLLMRSINQMLCSWYIFFAQIPWLPEWVFSINRFFILRKQFGNSMSEEYANRHIQAWSMDGAITGGLNYYRAAFRGYWIYNKTKAVVDVPVTMIWGDPDFFLLRELANLPNNFTNQITIKCPKTSHWPMWNNCEEFNKKLLYALSREEKFEKVSTSHFNSNP